MNKRRIPSISLLAALLCLLCGSPNQPEPGDTNKPRFSLTGTVDTLHARPLTPVSIEGDFSGLATDTHRLLLDGTHALLARGEASALTFVAPIHGSNTSRAYALTIRDQKQDRICSDTLYLVVEPGEGMLAGTGTPSRRLLATLDAVSGIALSLAHVVGTCSGATAPVEALRSHISALSAGLGDQIDSWSSWRRRTNDLLVQYAGSESMLDPWLDLSVAGLVPGTFEPPQASAIVLSGELLGAELISLQRALERTLAVALAAGVDSTVAVHCMATVGTVRMVDALLREVLPAAQLHILVSPAWDAPLNAGSDVPLRWLLAGTREPRVDHLTVDSLMNRVTSDLGAFFTDATTEHSLRSLARDAAHSLRSILDLDSGTAALLPAGQEAAPCTLTVASEYFLGGARGMERGVRLLAGSGFSLDPMLARLDASISLPHIGHSDAVDVASDGSRCALLEPGEAWIAPSRVIWKDSLETLSADKLIPALAEAAALLQPVEQTVRLPRLQQAPHRRFTVLPAPPGLPRPVVLAPVTLDSSGHGMLHWSATDDTAFTRYTVHRSTAAMPDTAAELVATFDDASDTSHVDSTLIRGPVWQYRVYLWTAGGTAAGSNIEELKTAPGDSGPWQEQPPRPVTLFPPRMISDTRVLLRWSESAALSFAGYRVVLDTASVIDSLSMEAGFYPGQQDTLVVVDGLEPGRRYRVAVMVDDVFGRSSEPVSAAFVARDTIPPEPVPFLDQVPAGEDTVDLVWARSSDENFLRYRLLRSDSPIGVTLPDSALLVTTDRQDTVHRIAAPPEGDTAWFALVVDDSSGQSSPPALVRLANGGVLDTSYLYRPHYEGENSIVVRWSRYQGSGFAGYRLRYDVADAPESSQGTVVMLDSLSDTLHVISEVDGDKVYRLFLSVVRLHGPAVAGNSRTIGPAPLRARLFERSTVRLSWTPTEGAFRGYRLYRGTEPSPGPGPESTPLFSSERRSDTLFVDENLDTGQTWYYRLFTDTTETGRPFPSNEVSAHIPWLPRTASMVRIPSAGQSVTMRDSGVDGAAREATFSRDFYIDSTEVTRADYSRLMRQVYAEYRNPAWREGSGMGDDSPVTMINWFDALLYCNARSIVEGRDTMYSYTRITRIPGNDCRLYGLAIDMSADGYRLPTEAEWEFACRAGEEGRWFWGEDSTVASEYCWYAANSDSSAQPVAGKKPNPFGLYDMSGNVREFCQDWFAPLDTGAVEDPTGPSAGEAKVVRGGGFADSAQKLRCGDRRGEGTGTIAPDLGFRVVGF
jgi:formylglycine-generating enzyme required for sulfatase activity